MRTVQNHACPLQGDLAAVNQLIQLRKHSLDLAFIGNDLHDDGQVEGKPQDLVRAQRRKCGERATEAEPRLPFGSLLDEPQQELLVIVDHACAAEQVAHARGSLLAQTGAQRFILQQSNERAG